MLLEYAEMLIVCVRTSMCI